MEEKERYELRIYAGCESYSISDTKEKQQLTIENVINLLNQQDKRIKELVDLVIEYKNKLYRRLDQVDNLIKENNQLKQTIKTMHQNVRNGSLEDVKHIEGLKEEIEDWREENRQLKQQLHDLPKKIVGEIIKELKTLYKNDPIIHTENKDIVKGCYDKDSINRILDTILTKYNGEQ